MSRLPRIYLAGPDVFYPDAADRYARLKAICARHGLLGVAPTDGAPFDVGPTPNGAIRVRRHNIATLQSCDALLGNIAPFDSLDADSGTAYEIGFAAACGQPVATYCTDGLTVRERVLRAGRLLDASGRDDAGLLVEDFGLPANLMLCAEHPFFIALEQAVEHLPSTLAEFSAAVAPRERDAAQIAELAMLVARLARGLRQTEQRNGLLSDAAIDYLRRKGLLASPLRCDASPNSELEDTHVHAP